MKVDSTGKELIYTPQELEFQFSLSMQGSLWWIICKYICKHSLNFEVCFDFNKSLKFNSPKLFIDKKTKIIVVWSELDNKI
jgi:hypothetical protein